MSEAPTPAPRTRGCRRLLPWGFGVFVALCLMLVLGGLSMLGRQVTAPDWLREEIVTRVNAQLSGARISFGDMRLMVTREGVPQVSLHNVAVADAGGERLALLSSVNGTLAFRPLLRGQVQPGAISLSGATLRMRRSVDGTLGLAVGDGPRVVDEAVGFTALIGQMDEILMQPDLANLSVITVDNLTLQYDDSRARQSWTVDGGRLRLARSGDDLRLSGDFVLLGNRGYATTLEMNYQGRIGETQAEMGVSFADMPARDIARQSPALSWLEALDAPISGSLRVALSDEGSLGQLNASLQIGAGALQPTDTTKPIPFSGAHAYLTYDPVQQVIRFDDVALSSKWVTARAEATAYLVGMSQGLPQELWTQIRIGELSVNPAELYPEPVVFDGATLDMRLRLDPFTVTLGEMSLADQGQRLVLRGAVEARPEGWALALDGQMDGLTPERLVALWPEGVKDNTRTWIRDNVVSADLQNIDLALRTKPQTPPDVSLQFEFADLETRFMNLMPLIHEARGHGALLEGRFALTAVDGYVPAPQGGRVDITGTSFVIPDVTIPETPAEVHLRTHSTVTAALALLDHAPFGFLTKAGQPVTLADGQIDIAGRLDLRLKDRILPEDVRMDVQATARQVRSETLVPGRVLAAPELLIAARDGRLEISGEGRIGRVPVTAIWRTRIDNTGDGRSSLAGSVELSERFVDEFNVGLPPDSLSGAGQGRVEIDFARDQPAVFRLSSDLVGVGLRLRPLGWSLPREAKGELAVVGTLGAPPEIKAITLAGAGLSAEGSISLRPDGQLDRATFARVRVGAWLDAPVELVGRGAGAMPEIRVTGGTIDLRQTSVGGDGQGHGSGGQPGPLSLMLERLQISDGISLTDFQASLTMANGADGEFRAKVNDGAAITGRVIPQSGRSAFRITSENAGAVMRSAGVLQNARDGQMDLVLLPGSAKGSYDGRLSVTSFRLKDAPALAALLNTLSIVGLLEQLAGDGIHFSEVEAEFQLTPERITLTRGSAVGASMGISMEGYYFMDRAEMDMQGVFSPFYLVNAVGGIFTRKGEGLVGFNYRLNGPAASPQVRVNPLSLLTPGMFREIFRRPPPEVQR